MTRLRRVLGFGIAIAVASVALVALTSVPATRGRLYEVARRARNDWRASQARAQRRPSTATLRCAPARTYRAARPDPQLADVPDSVTVSALLLWDRDPGSTGRSQLQRARTRVPAGALDVRTLAEKPLAVVLTGRAVALRAVQRDAPRASVQLAASGTRELCVVAG